MGYSFPKGILWQMNPTILFDKIIDFPDNSSAADLISLDFYKAFDTVERLVKLERRGVSGAVRGRSGALGRIYDMFGTVWGAAGALGSLRVGGGG